ncbi:LysE/ArgO family amino acid transporter [Candidatus Aalborgicola defluviihabitans]|uniref:LysE/ArgO family amino acid transporter n=1 Tax=Candidatus Aalborgicola defluviihabitans TaxID=3386187 RepID=UPI001D20538A|nr:amino acid transporter [Burkholderiales bacterium]MBL0242920.1 amino acid transporter [Rhodoferax sp.]
MNADFMTGLATSLALIIAIGSQNAYVLRQGIRREHVAALVLFCSASDALLILAGIGGAGVVLRDNATLMAVARYGGAVFLAGYGILAARRAWVGDHMVLGAAGPTGLGTALTACFGFTFLNPHVYLDTVVLLGAVANQHGEDGRWVFGAGACTASLLWFSALGFGARLLAPLFARTTAWRVLDSVIALMMWALAATLLLSDGQPAAPV